MSRITQQPAARSLFSTLLATRPQRAPRITLADAAVATVVHLAALGFLIGVNRNNETPGFAEEPHVHTLILSDQVWLPLRLPVGAPAEERPSRTIRQSRGEEPRFAAAAPPLSLPDLEDIVPRLDEDVASAAFEAAANALNSAVAALGNAINRDSVTSEMSFDEIRSGVRYTPYSSAPELLNRGEIARLLERRYPRTLSSQGVGGSTMLWLLIDKEGKARKALIQNSSGREAFDALAVEVVPFMRFRPARNNGSTTVVWVQLPVRFQVVDVYQ